MKIKVLFILPPILLLPHSVWSETKGPPGPPKTQMPNANTLHFLKGKLEHLNKISKENAVSPDLKKNIELLKKKIEELEGKAEKDKQDGVDTIPSGQQACENVSQNGLEEKTPCGSNEGKAEEKKTQVKNVIFMKKEKAIDEEVGNKDTAIITEKKKLPIEESPGMDGTQAKESIEGEALPGVIVDKTGDSPKGEILSGSETEAKKKEMYFHPYYGPYFNHHAYYNYYPYYNYPPVYNPYVTQTKDYEVVKKLIDACFNKGEGADPNVPCIIDLFKKVLDDEGFRNEFKTFMYNLYEFAKKNDVLSDGGRKNELMKFFFDNALRLINTMLHY
ncbi:merozoite surface protein 7 [Plasmodium cynomolgi strain B]|uniref:Merozoite surface protein 7 n=1 Tax=Plasmodium cynomolgi (strain B) TaxID=1120755 RepID=K6VEM1_PLACD|nr:merozoite surface protein 7 [Plasmodium cynomolgi strain B]GAB67707.1 merozoite surface protein 7 [Plasmodium cynomolgi strain B]